jgi:signal transduction histidine kinase
MIPDSATDLRIKLDLVTEALRKAEGRALAGQFALEVMHEIRNPLEALGYLIHLAQTSDDPEVVQPYLRQADEQMVTVHRIAAQALGFARVATAPETVDLIELAEAAVRIHYRRLQAQRIHLVRNFADDVRAEVYAGEILQVVSNLVANAIEALPEGGTIALRLRKRGDMVQLLVADSGEGLKVEHTARLFEPFFTTKQNGGTGLGLALTKKIVERHGGSICARSSRAGKRNGTTFKIVLPHRIAGSIASGV